MFLASPNLPKDQRVCVVVQKWSRDLGRNMQGHGIRIAVCLCSVCLCSSSGAYASVLR